MGMQFQHDTVDVSGHSFVPTSTKEDTLFSKASRFLSVLLFWLSICLLFTLLFLFGTALYLNLESMIFDMYTYLSWTGSLILVVLVAMVMFKP